MNNKKSKKGFVKDFTSNNLTEVTGRHMNYVIIAWGTGCPVISVESVTKEVFLDDEHEILDIRYSLHSIS